MTYLRHIPCLFFYVFAAFFAQVVICRVHSSELRPSFGLWQTASFHTYRSTDDRLAWSRQRSWIGSWYCISGDAFYEPQGWLCGSRYDNFGFMSSEFKDDPQYLNLQVSTPPISAARWSRIWETELESEDYSGHSGMVMRISGFPFPFLRSGWLIDESPDWRATADMPASWKVAIGRDTHTSNNASGKAIMPEIAWAPAIGSLLVLTAGFIAVTSGVRCAFQRTRSNYFLARGRCEHCGYPAHADQERCPECGRSTFQESAKDQYTLFNIASRQRDATGARCTHRRGRPDTRNGD